MSTLFTSIEVVPNGGGEKYTVDVDMATAFVWETTYPGRSLGELVAKPRMSAHDMYELAYVGSKRAGKPVPSKLMEFVEANDVRSATPVVTEDQADDVGNPTHEGPSTTT
jgi:hypothetical protein